MSQFLPVAPFHLYIFGGTGDLCKRKLLPALFRRDADGQFAETSRITAIASRKLSREEYCKQAEAALKAFLPKGQFEKKVWARFVKRLDYISLDLTRHENWGEKIAPEADCNSIFYLAIPPSLYAATADGLRKNGLQNANMRIVVEKPIGHDYQSAKKINDALGRGLSEKQIFRIDHYLGKETVQNLLALRFGNTLFEHIWSRSAIDHVQISVLESIGVEGRGKYYDSSGAMRDMVQNHLLRILCLVAMEPPVSIDSEAVRDEKMKVLRSLKPIDNIADNAVRGQYAPPIGEKAGGYRDEEGVGRESDTESFVALKVEIENWRWAGVPFYLRTGKRLAEKRSEIVIQFRDVPHSIFSEKEAAEPNRLILRLQPEEAVSLTLMTKKPGPGGFHLESLPLNLNFSQYQGVQYHDAYERLLMDVLRGNTALFMRDDEVETAWQWVDICRKAWEGGSAKMTSYPAKSWGPQESDILLARSGRKWRNE
ncbi:MAG: glucose-6-phosphate dehydrogenase [Parvibaculales bacterium]